MIKIYSPLEQFEIKILTLFSFFGQFDISITNNTISIILVCSSFLFLGMCFVYNAKLVPGYWQGMGEVLYTHIMSMTVSQTGFKGQKFFPIMFWTFFFILFCNILGLFPFSFTATAQVAQLFTLSLSFCIGFTILGFKYHGVNLYKLFVPSNVPGALIPLITLIEVLTFSLRPLSLTIRLFANMVAGHTSLHIIAGFAIALFNVNIIAALFPWILVIGITFLEILIAVVQSYVYLMLLSIYLHDSIQYISGDKLKKHRLPLKLTRTMLRLRRQKQESRKRRELRKQSYSI